MLWRKLRRLAKDKEGATAVEAAIVFPLLIMCLFAVLGAGTYMYGSHQAQRTVEKTAREVRMMNNPSKEVLYSKLKGNMGSAPFGTYSPNVEMITQFNGNYAELTINYQFKFGVPFLDQLKFNSNASTQVKLRQMPT